MIHSLYKKVITVNRQVTQSLLCREILRKAVSIVWESDGHNVWCQNIITREHLHVVLLFLLFFSAFDQAHNTRPHGQRSQSESASRWPKGKKRRWNSVDKHFVTCIFKFSFFAHSIIQSRYRQSSLLLDIYFLTSKRKKHKAFDVHVCLNEW